MKFGKLEDISAVDFTLPSDHSVTGRVLNSMSVTPRVLVGGTMWNIPEWIGKIFPAKTPKKDLMGQYGAAFGTIELNATHYKIPDKAVVRKWYQTMPEDFLFCPKFPQLISHYRRFNNCESLTDEFLEAILELQNKLSFAFIQLPPNYTADKAEALLQYLTRLPRDMRFALEFRHESWFSGSEKAESVWSVMPELGITSVISDTAGRRDAVHMRLTTPYCIVRYGGNEMDGTDEKRLSDWIDRIAMWSENGLEEFQFWIHQPNSVKTPETALYIKERLHDRMNVRVKCPDIIATQGSLF